MENKLLEFQKKIGAIKKDGKNPHFKSSYATLPQILSEVKPILNELGITLLQPIKDGYVFTILLLGDADCIHSSSIKLPEGLTPQQLGSAITYFRRYTLASLLALEIEDDDGNAASQPAKKPELKTGNSVYDQAVKFLQGSGTLEQIKAKYNMGPDVEDQLKQDAGI